MTKLYRDEIEGALSGLWSGAGGAAPGKRSMTQGLSPRAVVFRLESAEAARELGAVFGRRDGNGVAEGAEAAVDGAAGSSESPLPGDLRRRFEASLGADLSQVRVHAGSESAHAARAVGAHAYTVGQDIHFGAGKYDPGDPFGMHLLAHEVAHTAQQAGRVPERQHKLEVSAPHDAAEADADRAADAMVKGAPVDGKGRHKRPRKAKRPKPAGPAPGGPTPEAAAAAPPAIEGGDGELHRAVDDELAGEDERDDAVIAPAAGGSAVIHRAPADNSYNRGELTWGQGGTALSEEETKAWWDCKSGVLIASSSLIGKAVGFQGAGVDSVISKLEKDAKDDFAEDVKLRKLEIAHFETQVENLEDDYNGWWEPKRTPAQDGQLADWKKKLAAAEAALETLEDSRSDWLARKALQAKEIASTISSYGGKSISVAGAINTQSGSLKPELFENMSDANSKIQKVLDVIDLTTRLLDRTAIDKFKQSPSQETAEAWARQVGAIFKSASAFASGLPMGWDQVVAGVMQMPAIVIDKFIQIVRKRYAKIDAETKDHDRGSVQLPEGGTG